MSHNLDFNFPSPHFLTNTKIYFENIVKMENYFVREWVGNNLKSYVGLTLQDIGNMDTFHMNEF